eukprot:GCRY01003151.1.p1 GENE.GCRY01003151.1~~GCRY01003151.1.p1  ORF type:complete len:459 (+),score=77.90 GCRY01003151.1:221-1597(+)
MTDLVSAQPGENWKRKSKPQRHGYLHSPHLANEFPLVRYIIAAAEIQRFIRGFLVRVHRQQNNSVAKPAASFPLSGRREHGFLEAYQTYSKNNVFMQLSLEDYAAFRIQRWYKRLLVTRRSVYNHYDFYSVAAVTIQRMWRSYRYRAVDLVQVRAVQTIQLAWRRFSNRQIFLYYRDLIRYHELGDPGYMLKCINPREAALFDIAAGIHVRFRLAGAKFPPFIVYKVFTHRPTCDVNSFAPRDYVAIRETGINTKEGWYRRFENNGWRAVNEQVLVDERESPGKALRAPSVYVPKTVSRDLLRKKRREKKIEWLKKVYRGGVTDDLIKPAPSLPSNIRVDQFEEFETETDKLLQWAETLDFDRYTLDYLTLATTGPSDGGYVTQAELTQGCALYDDYTSDYVEVRALEEEERERERRGEMDPSSSRNTLGSYSRTSSARPGSVLTPPSLAQESAPPSY